MREDLIKSLGGPEAAAAIVLKDREGAVRDLAVRMVQSAAYPERSVSPAVTKLNAAYDDLNGFGKGEKVKARYRGEAR